MRETPERETPFSPGDRVRRKGGGPVMAVWEVLPALFVHRYRCTWKDGGEARSGLFRADELEPAEQ